MTRVWRWFRFAWVGHGVEMGWLLVGSAMTAALYAAFAWLWKVVVDAAQTGDASRAGLLCLAVGVGQSALYVLVQGTRVHMNERIQQRARQRIFDHLTHLDAQTLSRWRTGDLVTRLTDDVSTDKLAWFLCSGVFRAYEAALIVIACVGGMLWLDPLLTVVSLLPLPLLLLSHARAADELGRRATRVQEEVSRLSSVLQDTFDGIRVVQARGLGELARRAMGEAAARQQAAEVHNARLAQLELLLFGYGWQVALAVLLGAGGWRVMTGVLGLGDFVAFNAFVMTLVFPMFDFGTFLVKWRQAEASLVRLDEVLDTPTAPILDRAERLDVPGRIELGRMTIDLGAPLT